MGEVKKRGGKREGAGRNPLGLGRENFIIYVTKSDQTAIRTLVDSMRNELSVPYSNYYKKELDALQLKYDNEISVLKSNHNDEIHNLKTKYEYEINVLKSNIACSIHELDTLKSITTQKNIPLKDIANDPTTIDESAIKEQLDNTVAGDERIWEVYKHNEGMTKGRYQCIANILNHNKQLTKDNEQWTLASVKYAITKLRKERNK